MSFTPLPDHVLDRLDDDRLVDRAGLRRSEVVARLAAALHAGDRQPRVAGYDHEMEQGRLPAAGVSERVLAALGEILGESAPRRVDGQNLSGLLLPAGGEIWVNADEARRWPTRRRFTIAHELGHRRMHRGAGDAVFCRSTAIDPGPAGASPPVAAASPGAGPGHADRTGPPPAEQEANAFAASVLMPARLIRERYARQPRDFPVLCAAFGASGAAMGRRLHTVIPRAGGARTPVRR